MSTLNDFNGGEDDYVLVHKSKAKISRARKFVIGTMMVGAVAAIAGAGTFASFSASTDNSAAFSTARMALKNGTNCITPAGVAAVGQSATSTAVDDNNTACAPLFPNPLTPGEEASKNVDITNVGDVTGDLVLFATSACNVTSHLATYDRGTALNLCSRVGLTIGDVAGTKCYYPLDPNAGCPALTPGSTATNTFSDFGTSKNFANRISLATLAQNGVTNVHVAAMWRKTVGSTDCNAALSNHPGATSITDTAGGGDGFDDNTGQGCDNPYQNQTANLTLRWQIQG